MARVIQVIETDRHVGAGTDLNPHRIVRQFFALDGTLLMEQDDWKVMRDAKYSRDVYASAVAVREALATLKCDDSTLVTLLNTAIAACEGREC